MKKARSLKSKEALTQRTETSVSTIETIRSISNGILFTLINGKVNQPRVNSTKDSVFTLKETSTLFQPFQVADILISSTTETWSLRLEMEEEPKSGTSINNL